MRETLIATVVGIAVCLGIVYVLAGDSAEVKSYNWAKAFCGGNDTDIKDYRYIMDGRVICKDGRLADVPK